MRIVMTPEQQNRDLGNHDLAENILVDFCCMNKLEFTLREAAEYHGIPLSWYNLNKIRELSLAGHFSLIESK